MPALRKCSPPYMNFLIAKIKFLCIISGMKPTYEQLEKELELTKAALSIPIKVQELIS